MKRIRSPLRVAFVAALGLAGGSAAPDPGPADQPAIPGVEAAADPTRTHLAPDRDGALSADPGAFAVRFDAGRMTLLPKGPDGRVRADLPFAYEFVGLFSGGVPAAPGGDAARPTAHQANRIEFQRSDRLTERYDVLDAGVEQIFVLHEAPGPIDGDLEIRGRLSTPLQADDPDPGPGASLVFRRDGEAVVNVGAVLVRDASGRESAGRLRTAGLQMSIVIDGGWLAAAVYPVEVDPLIGPSLPVSAYGPAYHPEASYSAASDQYLVVWERATGTTNADLWGALVRGDGSIVNSGFPIEASATSQQRHPTVSWAATTNRWVVCWEDDRNIQWPFEVHHWDIFCRVLEPTGTAVVSRGTVEVNSTWDHETRPDIACSEANCFVIHEAPNSLWGDTDLEGALIDPGSASIVTSILVWGERSHDTRPAITYRSSYPGGYMAAWESLIFGIVDIAAATFDRLGNRTGSCPVTVSSNLESHPDIAYNSTRDRYLIVWEQGTGLFAQIQDPHCLPALEEFRVFDLDLPGYLSVDPRVAGGAQDGCFAVTHQEYVPYPGRYDRYLRRVCVGGSIGDETKGLFPLPDREALGLAYSAHREEYLLAWATPEGTPAVFAQRYATHVCRDFDADGYALCNTPCTLAAGDVCGDCDDALPDVHPGAPEICDLADSDCDGTIPPDETDLDGDLYAACSGECDDADPSRHPGAVEGCDHLDTDCDGAPVAAEIDDDGDGYAECDGDCDDANPAVSPGAHGENCLSGADDDCDGSLNCFDTDCATQDVCECRDVDGDNWVDCSLGCRPQGTQKCGDCDDLDPEVNPVTPEDCRNGIDDDCNGRIDAMDPACSPPCPNQDGDGWAVCGTEACAPALGLECGDCDDDNPAIHPGATEICYSGVDDNCDGLTDGADPGCPDCIDIDADGWADCGINCVPPAGGGCGDCDDGAYEIHPGAPEICDGSDDDCDGVLPRDEVDADQDAHWPCQGDCDDADPATYTGASEICDGRDNDCDGGLTPLEADPDGDGVMLCEDDCDDADPNTHPGAVEICDRRDNDCDVVVPGNEIDDDQDGYAECEGDCDDTDPSISPGVAEHCDTPADDDCDGFVSCWDPDCAGQPVCNCRDEDGDTWVDCSTGCTLTIGYQCGDCDDSAWWIYPGRAEDCGNGIDDDCDGLIDMGDPGCLSPCSDYDGDGWVVCETCRLQPGHACGDCDDFAPAINPAASDDVCDGRDNDCDGAVDDGVPLPGPITTLEVDDDSLVWGGGATGATAYQIVRGDLGLLRSTRGDFSRATTECLDFLHGSPEMPYEGAPGPGQGFWFLVRGHNCAGFGSYDSGGAGQAGSRDAGIDASAVCR